MKEIKAPGRYEHRDDHTTLFIAGGISNCEKWQDKVPIALDETDLVLINPRRDNFDVTNPDIEQEQIKWEHKHIIKASSYLFWFGEETLCPITLFELGKVSGLFPNKPIFVGTHPNYERKTNVKVQMLLLRPEIDVVHGLDLLLGQVLIWSKKIGLDRRRVMD